MRPSKAVRRAQEAIVQKFGYCDSPHTSFLRDGAVTCINTVGVGVFLVNEPNPKGTTVYTWARSIDGLKDGSLSSNSLKLLIKAVDAITGDT